MIELPTKKTSLPYVLDHGVGKEICTHCDALIGQAVEQRVEAAVQDGIKLAMESWRPDPETIREAVRGEVWASDIWDAEVDKLLQGYFQSMRGVIANEVAELTREQILVMAQEAVSKVLKQSAPKVASSAPGHHCQLEKTRTGGLF